VSGQLREGMSRTALVHGPAGPLQAPFSGRGPNADAPDALPNHLPGHRQGRPAGLDKETTRYLAAATQTHFKYAEDVVERVQHERFRALAPAYGVDVVVVTKWALAAVRRRKHRDYILAGLLPLSILLAWEYHRLLLIAVIVIISWPIVSWEHWDRIHNTVTRKMLRDRFSMDGAPDPPTDPDRRRLGKVAERRDGNLVVFSGHAAFVGSGKHLYHRRLVLDVSRGEDGEDGKPQDPVEFTSRDLHYALINAFGDEGLGDLETGLANVFVEERLFINGLHIQPNSQLLPKHFEPPPTRVSDYELAAATLHPTPNARTYVCVEMPGWQGQLVVTLFARAVHAGGCLYVEWSFRVLPPLHNEYLQVDKLYEQPTYRQLRDSLWVGLRGVVPALLASPYQVLRIWRRSLAARVKYSQQAAQIRRGCVFDYGALPSIREDACGRQRQHYFLARDEVMYLLLAQQTLLRAVENFLKDHQVSLGQFNEQVKIIVDQSVKIQGSGNVVGDNSSATVTGAPKNG
jgi:hypothetical protein